MIRLRATNSYTFVEYSAYTKSASSDIYNALRNILSYEVPSAEWSDKFKTNQWDGRISLYNGKERKFPAGLTDHVFSQLTTMGMECEIVDERPVPWENAKFSANYGPRKLRDYQQEGPVLLKKHTRGILDYGTGSGKTLTLCETLCLLSCKPVCVIVPGISLLKQTASEIEDVMLESGNPIKVGRVGGKFYDAKGPIVVTTYQSALAAYNTKFIESKNKLAYDEFAGEKVKKSIPDLEIELREAKRVKNLKQVKKIEQQIIDKQNTLDKKHSLQRVIETCQVFIVDECHLAAEIIEFLSLKADNAYYKCGLSATVFRTDNQEIRIQGALGGVLKKVPSSELISRGYLIKPTILMFKVKHAQRQSSYAKCYDSNVINNDQRNMLITQLATISHKNGLPTVILVERIAHGEILQKLIPNSVFVPGKEKGDEDPTDEETDYRRRQMNAMERNEIILIATQWFFTGLDCPPLQTMILAGSGMSPITTYQQIGRLLRLSPDTDKQYAVLVDFYDADKYLQSHSAVRKKTYKLEPEYDFRLIS